MGFRQLGARVKVLVLGSSGIIGQHMRLCVPDGITPIWHRRTADVVHVGCDLNDQAATEEILRSLKADVIINLAGECSVDCVEREPHWYEYLNAAFPDWLSGLCEQIGARLIHVSTQAVFDGQNPPYGPSSPMGAVNEYGRQKIFAERAVKGLIVRPTFVLGVRPMKHVGRQNPVEQMLAGTTKQVNDRWFSPSFASDVARGIWAALQYQPGAGIVHLGLPIRTSRWGISQALGASAVQVQHSDFPGIAERPADTHYEPASAGHFQNWQDGLAGLKKDWCARETGNTLYLARQISIFLGIHESESFMKLCGGFSNLHRQVAADFRRANPKTDEGLLEWYRSTEAYIWELTAYHADLAWNYKGMCEGVCARLKASGAHRVLCLGDGIGDLTLALRRAGIDAVYHDLAGSKTARFAAFRYWAETGETLPQALTGGWAPEIGGGYDCVASFDFLEHVTDVPAWSKAIREALVPGGLFFVQNAFACGSGEKGSIPCHLARNDRYEKDWDPLMASIGMVQESSNWYRKVA